MNATHWGPAFLYYSMELAYEIFHWRVQLLGRLLLFTSRVMSLRLCHYFRRALQRAKGWKKEDVEFISTITLITTLAITQYDMTFNKGIEAHPPLNMSKKLSTLLNRHWILNLIEPIIWCCKCYRLDLKLQCKITNIL